MASIKLSVTHRATLQRKYAAPALKRIDDAVAAWIAADAARDIRTVHVALDDAGAMGTLGVPPVRGRLTPVRAKRTIDALSLLLGPVYLVILGGDDVVPMFRVANPSHDPKEGDDDSDVATDNPYATARPYRAAQRRSYLVPDRVVGRIADVPCADGAGDAAWLVTPLRQATAWKPRAREFYDDAYATCCDAWKKAGAATMRYLGLPAGDLLISPPTTDTTPGARRRLARTLHMTKCHGTAIDARWSGQKGKDDFPDILHSDTLRKYLTPGTLAAAMCCYGAQVFAPDDPRSNTPGSWPMSLAYLRGGAVGFMGATRIAWVGPTVMVCADWIVASYLKKCLEGASIGRALLESKQDYMQFLEGQGVQPDEADEKTMLEFVLLGDPSMHPVRSASAPAALPARRAATSAAAAALAAPAAMMRAERRAARQALGAAVTRQLPQRSLSPAPPAARARQLYQAAKAWLGNDADLGEMDPSRATCSRLTAPPQPAVPPLAGAATRAVAAAALAGGSPALLAARAAAVAATPRAAAGETMEYGWSCRRHVDGRLLVRLLKVQTDGQGRILRTRVLHSA